MWKAILSFRMLEPLIPQGKQPVSKLMTRWEVLTLLNEPVKEGQKGMPLSFTVVSNTRSGNTPPSRGKLVTATSHCSQLLQLLCLSCSVCTRHSPASLFCFLLSSCFCICPSGLLWNCWLPPLTLFWHRALLPTVLSPQANKNAAFKIRRNLQEGSQSSSKSSGVSYAVNRSQKKAPPWSW